MRGDAGNPQQGIAAVEKLVGDKVDIFVGTYISAVSNAASDAALRYSKVYWDTNALAADLTSAACRTSSAAGPMRRASPKSRPTRRATCSRPALGKPIKGLKVWIESEDSIYGTSIAKHQKEILEKEGATVVGVGAHNFRAIDLTDSVLRAKGAAPDVWINTGYVPDGNLLLRTMRDQGFKPAAILLVGTGDTFETLDALGAEYLEGITVVGYPRPDQTEGYGPGAAAYLAAYKKKYERDPIAPQGMAAYVGVQMLIEAIARRRLRRHGEGARGGRQDGQAGEELRDRLRREVRRTSSRTRAPSRRWCSGSPARSSRYSRRKPRSRTSSSSTCRASDDRRKRRPGSRGPGRGAADGDLPQHPAVRNPARRDL